MSILTIICITIFLFSSQSGYESSQISNNIFIRKLGHFSEYAALGFFTFAYLSNIFVKNIKKSEVSFTLMMSFLFSVMYATSDEIHQIFVAGRDGNLKDVLIDSSGAFFGIVISGILFYFLFFKKK